MIAARPAALVDLSNVESLLICPRCRSRIVIDGDAYVCSSTSCVFSPPNRFPSAAGQPVFVDFDDSVLQRSDLDLHHGEDRVDRLPRLARRLLKPKNRVAQRNVRTLLSQLSDQALILVIGGGTMGNGVEAVYEDPRFRVLGFDIFASRLTQFIADAHRIPVTDGSVDAVIVQAVLEHVLEPDQVVSEIHRVLRPAGLVYAETPFMQQVHAGALDFTRYTSSGHRYLFRAFEEIDTGPVAGPGTQLLWSIDHLAQGVFRSKVAGKLVKALFFWLRYLDRIVPQRFAMDDASAYFFLGRPASRALSASEIVQYYRGAQREPRAE
jgi:ubiquinone/menaquinone biosynthesis C-methylase UbiE